MGQFAKLFDLDGGEQVLVTKSYDEDEKTYNVALETEVGDIQCRMSARFNDEEKAYDCFKNINAEYATSFRADMEAQFS
jgi:hypothetical protein